MKEKYPLEHLVMIKARRLEEAEKVLKAKKEALAKEEATLKELEEKRDQTKRHRHDKINQLREELDKGTTTDKITAAKTYIKVVDEELAERERKVNEQEKKVKEAEEEVEISYAGDDIEIGFNVNYLLEALGAIASEEVELAVVDGNSSCLLRDPGNDKCKYVVMPMRL